MAPERLGHGDGRGRVMPPPKVGHTRPTTPPRKPPHMNLVVPRGGIALRLAPRGLPLLGHTALLAPRIRLNLLRHPRRTPRGETTPSSQTWTMAPPWPPRRGPRRLNRGLRGQPAANPRLRQRTAFRRGSASGSRPSRIRTMIPSAKWAIYMSWWPVAMRRRYAPGDC